MGNSSQDANSDLNRCDYIENLVKHCDKEFIFYPENKYRVLMVIRIKY